MMTAEVEENKPEPMDDDEIEEVRDYAQRTIDSNGHEFVGVEEIRGALIASSWACLDLISRIDDIKAKIREALYKIDSGG